jgi:LacI family transcriptional regulator
MGSHLSDKDDLRHIQSFGFPVLLFDRYIAGENINSVTIDNRGAIASSVEWLINNGHKKIAFLSVVQALYNSRERFAAFVECMRENGLEAEHIIMAEHDIDVFVKWLDKNEFKATGIVAESDLTAYRAIFELTKRGFVIGRDVSVIGLDDLPYSSISVPPLSSVNINNEKRGEIALKRLLEMIDSPENTVTHIEVGTRLVIRESSTPVK